MMEKRVQEGFIKGSFFIASYEGVIAGVKRIGDLLLLLTNGSGENLVIDGSSLHLEVMEVSIIIN